MKLNIFGKHQKHQLKNLEEIGLLVIKNIILVQQIRSTIGVITSYEAKKES